MRAQCRNSSIFFPYIMCNLQSQVIGRAVVECNLGRPVGRLVANREVYVKPAKHIYNLNKKNDASCNHLEDELEIDS